MNSLARICFLATLFLAFTGTANGQFYYVSGETYFKLQDENGNLIKGAKVWLNEVPLVYSDSCHLLDGGCYRGPAKNRDLHRIKVRIKHKDYLPFNDSIRNGAQVCLLKKGQKDFYYHYTRIPYYRQPNHYVSAGPKEHVLKAKNRIENNGGKVLREYPFCGGKVAWGNSGEEEYGQYMLEYFLPETDSSENLKLYLFHNYDTGPMVKRRAFYHDVLGVANYFSVGVWKGNRAQAIRFMEQLKTNQTTTLLSYSEHSSGNYSEFVLYFGKGSEEHLLHLVDDMLKTGLFIDPMVYFYQYICPG